MTTNEPTVLQRIWQTLRAWVRGLAHDLREAEGVTVPPVRGYPTGCRP